MRLGRRTARVLPRADRCEPPRVGIPYTHAVLRSRSSRGSDGAANPRDLPEYRPCRDGVMRYGSIATGDFPHETVTLSTT